MGRPKTNIWLGLGIIPYENFTFSAKLEFSMNERWLLNLRTQLGEVEGTVNLGFSVTVKQVF